LPYAKFYCLQRNSLWDKTTSVQLFATRIKYISNTEIPPILGVVFSFKFNLWVANVILALDQSNFQTAWLGIIPSCFIIIQRPLQNCLQVVETSKELPNHNLPAIWQVFQMGTLFPCMRDITYKHGINHISARDIPASLILRALLPLQDHLGVSGLHEEKKWYAIKHYMEKENDRLKIGQEQRYYITPSKQERSH